MMQAALSKYENVPHEDVRTVDENFERLMVRNWFCVLITLYSGFKFRRSFQSTLL